MTKTIETPKAAISVISRMASAAGRNPGAPWSWGDWARVVTVTGRRYTQRSGHRNRKRSAQRAVLTAGPSRTPCCCVTWSTAAPALEARTLRTRALLCQAAYPPSRRRTERGGRPNVSRRQMTCGALVTGGCDRCRGRRSGDTKSRARNGPADHRGLRCRHKLTLDTCLPCRSITGTHGVKRNPIDERVLVDRPRVRGAPAQRLAVGLAGASDVGGSD